VPDNIEQIGKLVRKELAEPGPSDTAEAVGRRSQLRTHSTLAISTINLGAGRPTTGAVGIQIFVASRPSIVIP